MSYDDFKEFASLRKELHKLQVALEFYQKTTGQFTLEDLKVRPTDLTQSNFQGLFRVLTSSAWRASRFALQSSHN